ncbi:MAG: RICIN domain-containing protein, partial [Paludibacter sp.]
MKINRITILILLSVGLQIVQIKAQTTSVSNYLVAQPVPDRTVNFCVTDSGVSKPITWGLDLAWLSKENIQRGIAFMGADRVDVVRSSFTPTDSLVNGDLKASQLATLNQRLAIIDLLGANTTVMLNDDNPTVAAWYKGNASHWAQLMDVTTRRVQEHGRKVVSIAPFNEPDNTGTGQGTTTDFYNIAVELRKNSRFDSIRISGGNTLNTDAALTWYNPLKSKLDEGNTHQLAGSFDNYANFFTTVRADGKHATNDELHNVMEAMVGVEYGLQTGIWWGTAELARGEFVKASDGKRLGYAEHRPNWTAASVYRRTDGKVQAFGGTSERQSVTTTYRFVSKDRDVYYDGYGPQREYTMVLPGGTGYQVGQTNAERVVNITWGDDIQPAINGRYVLVNRNSGKVMEVAGGSLNAGANVQQGTNTGATWQQWNVTPVDSRIGGDFSYFTFTAVHSGKAVDLLNWSLVNGGNIDAWDDNKNSLQQWYLDYADNGWFYIRSRFSTKCLEVANAS